jgi:hypothetical protein
MAITASSFGTTGWTFIDALLERGALWVAAVKGG